MGMFGHDVTETFFSSSWTGNVENLFIFLRKRHQSFPQENEQVFHISSFYQIERLDHYNDIFCFPTFNLTLGVYDLPLIVRPVQILAKEDPTKWWIPFRATPLPLNISDSQRDTFPNLEMKYAGVYCNPEETVSLLTLLL